MSTPSIPRLKDRGAAASVGKPKPQTPLISENPISQNAPRSLHKSSSGKENPQRPASRPRASSVTRPKPIMPSMARVSKEVGGSEARARWSTSASRGRSSSPSEFTRVLGDMRKGVNKIVNDRKIGEKGKLGFEKSGKNGIFVDDLKLGVNKNDKLVVDRKISEKGKWGLEKLNKNGVFVDDSKLGENKKVGGRKGVCEKLDKNGIFVDDLKLGENKRSSSRDGRNVCENDKKGIFVDDLKFGGSKKVGDRDGRNVCENERRACEKLNKNERFEKSVENKKVGARDGRNVWEDGKRVPVKLDKNGNSVDELKLGENKKVGSRDMRTSFDNSKRVFEKLDKNGSFDDLKIGENRKVGSRDGTNVCEDGKRVSEKLDKNGTFADDLKLVEDKIGRNVYGNSCSSSVEMRLNERIDSVEETREKGKLVLEKSDKNGIFVDDLKLVENKNYSSVAGRNLISKGESGVNGYVDSKDKKSVCDSTKLKSGNESTLYEQSDTFADTEMKYSGINVESYGSKDLIGNINVDLSIKDHVLEEVKVRASSLKSEKSTCKGSRVVGRSSVSSGSLKEKAPTDEGKGSTSSAKRYSSKLHEKLAFLEGKVKKIACDIKQTKEMLDLNNPDASKVILTDIQAKISGIEKAMGNVVGAGNANVGLLKDDGNENEKVKEPSEHEEGHVRDGKRPVKGLNVQELEARLFPHHKLLKDRTCLKPSSAISQIDESREDESTRDQKSQEKSKTAIDEIPIALDFMEPSKKEQSGIRVEDTIENTQSSEDAAAENNSTSLIASKNDVDFLMSVNEKLEEFDEQENTSRMVVGEENENTSAYMLKEIGHKISTGGWFVSEGEAVLLAHDDGSCSYYDITNSEEKAVYNPPVGISPNMWRDCWIVRAPSADGCAGRYVVAASAGNSSEAGFCSWDFYTKAVTASHLEDGTANVRTALADLPNNTMRYRNVISSTTSPEHQQWFYRPCGPLIASTASCQRSVKVYDIRDGEHVMRWELQKPVATMEYSSPLQWKNRGKLVVAEAETVSLWDVSSLSPQPLLSVSSSNRKISALHVNNTDAELGGGVRQRVSSAEVEGNDGVFCTADSINVLDFRQSSGIGLKIPKVGVDVQSVFSQGDSILLGCTSLKSAGRRQFSSQIQQFSLRGQKLLNTYVMPESNAHSHHKAITQVWGNSNLVMGVCGLGLCIYDSSRDEGLLPYSMDCAQTNNAKEVIGPDDLYYPSFDYLGSRVLLISRDRPALWRYVS